MDRTSNQISPKKAFQKTTGRLFGVWLILFLLFASLPAGSAQASITAQKKGSDSSYAVIEAVNAVRSANGLAPFKVNGALMAAAQAHSAYQASTDSASHTGRGGSSPGSRASAAGYAGGSVIENIYSGMGATPQQAVSWWQGEGTHLATLLSTRHSEAGAGVAVSDAGVVYYTLDIGSPSGSAASGSGSPSSPAAAGSPAPGAGEPTTVAFTPLQISTPNADGALIHEVQPGQTLWAIAAAYDINILDLLAINGLNANALIMPGQKIVIRQAGSAPTATQLVEEKTEQPTRTPRPSATPTRPATEQANLLPTQGASNVEKAQALDRKVARSGVDPLLVAIAVLVVGGLVLVLAGNVIKRAG